jgi:hypothetical protein
MPFDHASLQQAIDTSNAKLSEPAEIRSDDSGRIPRWLALIGGNGFDLAATEAALRRPGNYEANPIMGGGPLMRGALKVGTTALEGILLDRLAKEHPKAANIIGGAIGGGMGLLGFRNLRQGK